MPLPAMGPSTPRLSEVARHVVMPSGIVTTAWPRVVAQCREMDVEFDSWQHGVGAIGLGKRADGKYAATVGGIVLSIPRQVGKTFLVGMIIIALCILHPGLTVLWTAHRTRTATKTFGTLKGMTSRKKIAPFMLDPRNTNGEQEIRFKNGSVIMFGARELGFGRGFDEVDVEVFDEGQILTEKALEDMVAATNQSRHEAGALLFFMGTPPRPGDPGEEFSNRREDALSGKSEDMVYVEFSADPDADPDDWTQVAKANPSFPHRTPRESILRMRKNLTNLDSFRREAMGIWEPAKVSQVFEPGTWEACGEKPVRAEAPQAIAIAVSLDQKHAAIVAAAMVGDRVVVKPLQHGAGTNWVVKRAAELAEQYKVPVVIDGLGPAAQMIPFVVARKVECQVAKTGDILDSCADIFTLVTEGRLSHENYPELDAAVQGATKRIVRDRWAWGRRTSTTDISTLEAATLAAWWVSRPEVKATSVYESRGVMTI